MGEQLCFCSLGVMRLLPKSHHLDPWECISMKKLQWALDKTSQLCLSKQESKARARWPGAGAVTPERDCNRRAWLFRLNLSQHMPERRLPNMFPGCDHFASGLWSVCAASADPHCVESIIVVQCFSGSSGQY